MNIRIFVLLSLLCVLGFSAVQLSNLQSHWPPGSHHDDNVVSFHTNKQRKSREADYHKHWQKLHHKKQDFYINLLAQAEELLKTGTVRHTANLNKHSSTHHRSKHTHSHSHSHSHSHPHSHSNSHGHASHGKSSHGHNINPKAMRFRQMAFRALSKTKQSPACIPYVISVNAVEAVSKAGENVLDTLISTKHKEEKKRAETEEDRLQKLLDKDIKERKYAGAALAMASKVESASIQERIALDNNQHVNKMTIAQLQFSLNMRRVQESLQVYMSYMGENNDIVMPLGGGTHENIEIGP